MSATVAFLTRLHRIATDEGSYEQRAVQAGMLFDSYKAMLCSRNRRGLSNRSAQSAKLEIDRILVELRIDVLRAEISARSPDAAIFTIVRRRIELARRALAIPHRASGNVGAARRRAADVGRPRNDGRLRAEADPRDSIWAIQNIEALRQSQDLLVQIPRSPPQRDLRPASER
jgi:hypothetical protein